MFMRKEGLFLGELIPVPKMEKTAYLVCFEMAPHFAIDPTVSDGLYPNTSLAMCLTLVLEYEPRLIVMPFLHR
jgi:hypothetical protein